MVWIYTYTNPEVFRCSKSTTLRFWTISDNFGQQPRYIPPKLCFFQRLRSSVSFLHLAHPRLCLCLKVALICRRLTNLERFRNRVEEVGDENRAGVNLPTCTQKSCVHPQLQLLTFTHSGRHPWVHTSRHALASKNTVHEDTHADKHMPLLIYRWAGAPSLQSSV